MVTRVAIGGISHETNTYVDDLRGPTPAAAFQVARGEALTTRFRGTRAYVGGMLDAADELGWETVPTFYAICEPSGTITAEGWAWLTQELLTSLEAAQPFDVIALELHGAAVAEGVPDAEGDLTALLRQRFGDVPIVAAMDLHGNVSQAMADALDGFFGVHEYPHTDTWERGHEAVRLAARVLAGTVRPVTVVETVPVLLPPSTTQPGTPADEMNALCREVESRPNVLDCTVFHGFPYADVPHVGVHVVVTTDGDRPLADACASEVAEWVWANKERFAPEVEDPASAVRTAVALAARLGGPVVVNETSDNPGGGSPGDGTHLLAALLEAGVSRACFGFLCDPAAVALAEAAGVGGTVTLSVGGRSDTLHGAPVTITGEVTALSDGRYRLRYLLAGVELDHGPMACVRTGGIDLLLSSRPFQTLGPEVFELHGLDVASYDLVALKGSQHFRAGFAHVATAVVTSDAPGLTSQRVEHFRHDRYDGPLWPLDPHATYRPAAS